MRDRAYALTLLHPRELLLLLRVGPFAAAVPALMRLSLPRMAAAVTRPTRRRRPTDPELQSIVRVVDLAPRIASPLVRSGCLTRGVTLFWFIRRAGLDVELRFGLDPSGEHGPDAHCWLTLDGEPFLEKRDPRPHFTEIYRLPLGVAQ